MKFIVKAAKGKTLIKINIDSEVMMIKDTHGGGTAYQTKQVGNLLVASNIKQENAGAFDPIFGEVVTGEHKGKTAWFHKLCYKEALRYGNQNHLFKGEEIDEPKGDYLLIEDASIFFYTYEKEYYFKNGKLQGGREFGTPKIEMTPDWCLCEPIGDVTWEYVDGVKIKCRTTTGGLIIPAQKEDYKTDRAILRHIHPSKKEELGLNEGDIVYLDRACDLPVEDELNMKLGKIYFRVEVCNILGVQPNSNNDELNKRWRELQPEINKEYERIRRFFTPRASDTTDRSDGKV